MKMAPRDDEHTERQSHLKELTRKVTAAFFIPLSASDLLSPVKTNLSGLPAPYEELRRAFCSNLEGLLSTVTFPFEMAHASALDRHFQRLSTAERIRASALEGEAEETEIDLAARRDRVARNRANTKFQEFVDSSEGRDTLIDDTCHFLVRALEREQLLAAASELLLQGVVLAWGAFEVLARDCFVLYLNAKPDAVQRLLIDPAVRKRLELGKVSLETLAAHGFDLSSKMGTLLAEQQDLSDMRSIKAVYGALFPDTASLRDALGDGNLWLLSLRRHLVVHRRAIIDEIYLRGGDANQRLGDRLVVSPDALETHIKACIVAGRELLLTTAQGIGS